MDMAKLEDWPKSKIVCPSCRSNWIKEKPRVEKISGDTILIATFMAAFAVNLVLETAGVNHDAGFKALVALGLAIAAALWLNDYLYRRRLAENPPERWFCTNCGLEGDLRHFRQAPSVADGP
jgi:hypothetical protein